MNRGSTKKFVVDVDRGSRFNEAPIHESGKFCLTNELFDTVTSLQ